MKKLALFTLALLMLFSAADAGRKKPKAGVIKDGIYTDSKHNFEFAIHDNWKPRISKDEKKVRIALTQKNYAIPSDYVSAPDYTHVPRLVVYCDTTSFSVHTFIDSLTSDKFKSDQKKKIIREFDFLQERDIIPKGRKRFSIGEASGLMWKGQSKYVKEVSTSASSVGGKRVYGSYGGVVFAIKKGNNIVLFQLMCEWPYYESILKEVMSVVNSFKWPDSDA